jgi:hypothetical protein
MTSIRLLIVIAALSSFSASAQFISNPTATTSGSGTSTTVTGFSVKLTNDRTHFSPVAAGTTVIIDFYDPTGTKVSAESVDVGPGGTVTYPPPVPPGGTPLTVPAAAAALGGSMKVRTGATESEPLIWKNGAWIYGFEFKLKIDPLGLPGSAPQHWFIDLASTHNLVGNDPVFGPQNLQLVSSGFDLAYTPAGNDLFNVTVVGQNSFMGLSDGTYLSFAEGSLFGTIQVAVGSTAGLFDFSAIGLSGDWSFDFFSNYTSGTAVSFVPFEAPTFQIHEAPEPTTGWLAGLGLFAIGACHKLKKKQKRMESAQKQVNQNA